jgi:hypothetical protein
MKKFTLLFAIVFSNFLYAQTNITAYQQLASVNEQWKNQIDVSPTLKKREAKPLAAYQLQQFHLQETELLLRSRDVSHLSPALKKQRAKNLDILHGYWQRGLFPINEMHEGRQPYFIDKANTYCAVGYLMQQTGGDAIAKEIKATQNFSYLLDIHHPKLMKWVAHSGLSLDELALIQLPYIGAAPCLATEMHYNNTGVDMNEYIEIRQAMGEADIFAPFSFFDKVLFYDQTNTLYKTLNISQMQHLSVGGAGGLYYYNFPANENFADIGYFEIKASNNQVLSRISYNQTLVSHERLENLYYIIGIPTFETTNFNIGESESTPLGSSLTFCGLFSGTTTLQSLASSRALVNSCLALPISLSKFEYTLKENTVSLLWQTASESNSDYFDVERSVDGVKFEKLGKLKAAGNSSDNKDYSFIDNKPNYINHYRLKEVDFDGKTTYSKILFVKVQQASPIKIIENPVKKNLQLQLSIDASKIKSITVFDFMGRQLKTIKANSGLQNVDISNFATGKYLVQVIATDGQGYNIPFIKVE